ncbi:MAG: hypothetical protein HC853_02980 [Anaerolineae bacterium]|nr:hypothetical protein [Anaerolineae bacterium]
MMNKKYLNLILTVISTVSLVGCVIYVPPPPPRVPLPQELPSTKAACTDYANVKGGPVGSPHIWRFHLAFYDNDVSGCFEVRRTDNRQINWRTEVPCQVMEPGEMSQMAMAIPIERPEMASVAGPLTYTLLSPGNYISCDFNLNQLLQTAQISNASLGITMTTTVYTYTYFSMSALTYLSTSHPYSGVVVAINPQECSPVEAPACNPSTWWVRSNAPSTVYFETYFNGEDGVYITPGNFPYTTTLIQGWWVGIRTQYDTVITTDTLKLEHLHDQSQPVDDPKVQFKHQTTTYGQRYFLNEEALHFKLWGGSNKIYIGGLPDDPSATFNGALIQIMIDPGGGGAPNGGI